MNDLKSILEQMGFNKDAPESTKQAFLKNLERAANEGRVTSVTPELDQIRNADSNYQQDFKKQTKGQLSFDLSVENNDEKPAS